MYTIGELARLSKTTVRTLRYYNEIGLLSPVHVSEGGHRRYSEDSVPRLHYILLLKEIGFGLNEIRDIITNQAASPRELLEFRLKVLAAKIEEMEKSRATIQSALQIIDFGGQEDWDALFDTFSQSHQHQKTFREKRNLYFSDVEQEKFGSMLKFGEETSLNRDWSVLMNEIRESIELGVSPDSSAGQNFAKRWHQLVEIMYDGDWSLANKVWELQQGQAFELGLVQVDKRIVQFIEAAFSYTQSDHDE